MSQQPSGEVATHQDVDPRADLGGAAVQIAIERGMPTVHHGKVIEILGQLLKIEARYGFDQFGTQLERVVTDVAILTGESFSGDIAAFAEARYGTGEHIRRKRNLPDSLYDECEADAFVGYSSMMMLVNALEHGVDDPSSSEPARHFLLARQRSSLAAEDGLNPRQLQEVIFVLDQMLASLGFGSETSKLNYLRSVARAVCNAAEIPKTFPKEPEYARKMWAKHQNG